MKVLLENPNENRDEWTRIRKERRMLGASTAADVLGLSNRSPLEAWMSVTGRNEAMQDNQRLQGGRFLEEGIARWWAFDSGATLLPSPGMVEHPRMPFMACTPDFLYLEKNKGGLEVKNRDRAAIDDWSAGPPLKEMTQLQLYLEACELEEGEFAVCFGGNKLHRYKVVRDEVYLDAVCERLTEWYERHIVKDVAPPMTTGNDEERRAFLRLYPKDSGEIKAIEDPELIQLVHDWRERDAVAKAAEKEAKAMKATLMSYADTASYLALPDGTGISFKAHEVHHEAKDAWVETRRPFTFVKKVPR